MELDKFVKETLIAISKGVQAAKEDGDDRMQISPTSHSSYKTRSITNDGYIVNEVEFDVALTVEDTAEGGGKISVLGSNLGGAKTNKETLTSRVSFSVPISFE